MKIVKLFVILILFTGSPFLNSTSFSATPTPAPALCQVMSGGRVIFSGSGASYKTEAMCLNDPNSQKSLICQNIAKTPGIPMNGSYTVLYNSVVIASGNCAPPTPSPTPKPTATPTPKPSATPTPKPSATPTPSPVATQNFSCPNFHSSTDCVDLNASSWPNLISAQAVCDNPVPNSACSSKNLVGSCLAGNGLTVRIYLPATLASAQARCQNTYQSAFASASPTPAPSISCNLIGTEGFCTDYPGAWWQQGSGLSQAQADCSNGTFSMSSACPSAGRVGSCDLNPGNAEKNRRYYSNGFTLSTAKEDCTDLKNYNSTTFTPN